MVGINMAQRKQPAVRKENKALKKKKTEKKTGSLNIRPQTAGPAKRALLFQALIDAFPDTVILLGPKGELIACNKSVRQQLKKNKKSKKNSFFDLFPHPKPNEWKKDFLHYLYLKKPARFEREIDGKFYSHYVHPVTDKKGVLKFTVIFVQDVTDYHLTVNALTSSEEKYKVLLENISDI